MMKLKMKWFTILSLALLLFTSSSCSSLFGMSKQQKAEQYNYYINLAYYYETAAVTQDAQAEYYNNLAQGLIAAGAIGSQEEANSFLASVQSYRQNAAAYRQLAAQYKQTAEQYAAK